MCVNINIMYSIVSIIVILSIQCTIFINIAVVSILCAIRMHDT